jgi:hypothetical protein
MSAAIFTQHGINTAKVSNATHTGDVTDAAGVLTVKKINGVLMESLATGIVKNTTGTGAPSIAVAADFPTLNQNTTGNAATATTATTATNIAGGAVGAVPYQTANNSTALLSSGVTNTVLKSNGAAAPSWAAVDTAMLSTSLANTIAANTAKVSNITHTGDVTDTAGVLKVTKVNNVSLAGLATGILKNTTSTGEPTIAVAADFPTLNQSTTGNAATATLATTATTATNIAGGGVGQVPYQTGSGATAMLAAGTAGYVLKSNGSAAPSWAPVDLSAGISGSLPVASGGTGAATFTAGVLKANGTSSFTTVAAPAGDLVGTSDSQTLTNKTFGSGVIFSTAIPVASGGTGVTTSTGSGANVLSTSPTLITPVLGIPAAGSVLTNCTGLPLTTGVTGILPVANGGTGVTASTGTGENVLASTPTLITPILGTPTSGTLTNCTNLPLTTGVTGSLPAANGGTGQTVYTIGDVLFASTSTALSKLADVATGNALISGGIGVAPSYGKIGLTTHVTGTLPVASGGTGLSTITGYVKGTGTSPLSTSATIPVGDISGILPVANGGTGVTALASGFIKSNGTILTSSAAPISIADGGTGVTQSTYGEYYISSITATSIGTTGTFVKVSGTTTAGFLSNFTHPASNRLTYTGTATRKFLVAAALSFHGTATNDYKFAFHKNTSSLLIPSIISTTGAGAGNLAHVSIQTIVELSTNDFIEVFVTNADATNSATIDFMNVTAVALI